MSVVFAEQVYDTGAGTGDGVAGAEDNGGYTGIDDRTGTHGAGLQRDEQRTVVQPPV